MQSKGMEDFPLKELNEMEVTKLSDTEFKIMVIKMLKELTDNFKEPYIEHSQRQTTYRT